MGRRGFSGGSSCASSRDPLPDPVAPYRQRRPGFTVVEALIVFFLMTMVLYAAHKVFYSQAKLVTQSIEDIQTNENFRKITLFLGNDIREANQILVPVPIRLKEVDKAVTRLGEVLRVVKNELDPYLPPSEKPGSNGPIREVVYELEKSPNPMAPNTTLYKLWRTEFISDGSGSRRAGGGEENQRGHVIADNIREFVLFRTIRDHPKINDLKDKDDRLFSPLGSGATGTGNGVVHLKVVLERRRTRDEGSVYSIAMTTSFSKRGREVFPRQ